MTKALKIILGLFGLLVVVVLAAVIIIPLVVDPNDYRDDIARAVTEETGRDFEIAGEVSLSVFPWLGLEVGRMRLGNPPGFGDTPFVEIGSAAVGARLMPLLSRRLEVSTLRLEGLRINLVRQADGTANWEGLGADDGGARGEAGAAEETGDGRGPPPDVGPDGADGTFRLERIAGLQLEDALVRFEDRAAGTIIEAAVPTLSTGELAPGRPFELEAETMVTIGDGESTLDAQLEATVQFAEDFGAVTLRDFGLTGGFETGESQRRAFALRMPQLDADLEAQTLAIPDVSAEAAGVDATLDVTGERIIDAPAFRGRIVVEEFSPRDVFEQLGIEAPETADPAVLGSASLQAEYVADPSEARLQDLVAVLDDSTLEGTASIGLGEIPRIRADMALDAIDLDRYLPPETDAPAEEAPAGDVELAFEWLKTLDLDASFTAGRVKLNGLVMTGVEARAVARDGVLELQPLGAALYEGRMDGKARLDAREAPARLSVEQSLSGFQLLPFARDLADFERLTGVAEFDADLSTRAATTAGLVSGLDGELAFDLADGAFKGVNLWYEIQRAYALARGREAPTRTSPDTEFRRLTGTAVIRDGKLVNDDLTAGLPFLGVTGSGEVDLSAGTLDYRLNATVLREVEDEATGETAELAGATLPLRLSGTLDSPSVSVDIAGMLRDKATEEALRRLGVDPAEGESLEDSLKERAEDKFRSLRDRLRKDDGGS
ncbi:AsmA family protein [Wenzhouxiangella sp. XN24]|uniref:AsmA family protein n=1 Tax=Wenzhouxiangella sp. XN24 TaxID=2713569 RepID=UPI0013EA1E69|nr:AsmA family protein [Wenzhouxiangella sp. XN24]NGX17577.1 AsmA family protein [Wenzhouxiangella sp. XN24]